MSIIEVPDEKAPENMSDKEIEQVKKEGQRNTSQNQTTINSHYIRKYKERCYLPKDWPKMNNA